MRFKNIIGYYISTIIFQKLENELPYEDLSLGVCYAICKNGILVRAGTMEDFNLCLRYSFQCCRGSGYVQFSSNNETANIMCIIGAFETMLNLQSFRMWLQIMNPKAKPKNK